MGTITETYFEISGDTLMRISFQNTEDEARYHRGQRDQIADDLRPLAGKIKSLLGRLRKQEPWSRLLLPYRAGSKPEPEVDLNKLESPAPQSCLKGTQKSGPYRYATSFWHSPHGSSSPLDGLKVTVRFRVQGKADLVSLYELEDALRDLRSPSPGGGRGKVKPEDVTMMREPGCEKLGKELDEGLDKIRTAFIDKLQEAKLNFEGPENDRANFMGLLSENHLGCLVTVKLTLAGDHQRGRVKAAWVEAIQSVFKRASEPPVWECRVDLMPWRIDVPF